MDELSLIKTLSKIDKLTADIYSNLLNTYGEKLVNFVIEKMIDNEVDVSDKYAYYIDKILSYDNKVVAKNLFDAYMFDVNSISTFTTEENINNIIEIHKIIDDIEDLLEKSGCDIVKSSWISDRIDDFLIKCRDGSLIKKVSKLYDKFIYKRNLLVEGNLRLVVAFGKHFYRSCDDFNDLIQYGNMGLMKAIEKFDPVHNTSLSTYSYYWIKQSITRHMPSLSSPVSIPYKIIVLNMTVNRVIKKLTHLNGVEPTDEEIANYIGIAVDDVVEVKKIFLDSISLNDCVIDSDNSLSDNMLIDIVEDKEANVEEIIFFDEMSMKLKNILRESLTDKEYDVVCSRYGLYGYECRTLNEVGKDLGVSRERIRQIENNAVKRKLYSKCKEFKGYIYE